MIHTLLQRLTPYLYPETRFEIRSLDRAGHHTWATLRTRDDAERWIATKQFQWAAKNGTMFVAEVGRYGAARRLTAKILES